MAEITLVRQSHATLTDAQREALHSALFGMVDGLSDQDKKSWRLLLRSWWRLEVGEITNIDTWIPRHGGFHRRHMKIETTVFKAQDRVASFTQFRLWLKVGAGFVDWMAGPTGGVVPIAKSISYKKCDEDKMRQFHDDAMAFLRTDHAVHYLWPHLSIPAAAEMMETILGGFGE